ncbi:MAG TPA: hypothetical protein VHZ33_16720 [Trebonia sp.]|nr:hypothetical protein [Trebonia sp.]
MFASVTQSWMTGCCPAFAQPVVAPISASATPLPRADGRTHIETRLATPSAT